MGTPKEPPRMARNGSPLRTSNSLDSVPAIVSASGSLRAARRPLGALREDSEIGDEDQAPIHAARGRASRDGRARVDGPAGHRRDAHDHGPARHGPARSSSGGRAAWHPARGHRDPHGAGNPRCRTRRPPPPIPARRPRQTRAVVRRTARTRTSRSRRAAGTARRTATLKTSLRKRPILNLELRSRVRATGSGSARRTSGTRTARRPGRTRPSSTPSPARRASPASRTSSSASSRSRSSCCRSTRPPGSSTGSTGRCSPRSTRSRPTTGAT